MANEALTPILSGILEPVSCDGRHVDVLRRRRVRFTAASAHKKSPETVVYRESLKVGKRKATLLYCKRRDTLTTHFRGKIVANALFFYLSLANTHGLRFVSSPRSTRVTGLRGLASR